MDPENVKIVPVQAPGQAIVERPPEGHSILPPQGREDFMPVSSGQGDIPCNEFSKAGVKITFQGKIAAEKHRQINTGLRGNPAQQGGLVLDRVGHQVC
jgi:hypothetical protein